MAAKKRKANALKSSYWSFRARCRQRRVNVDFNLHSWLEWWYATGKLHLRGSDMDQYCMSRIDSTQNYGPDNVECIKNKDAYKKPNQ